MSRSWACTRNPASLRGTGGDAEEGSRKDELDGGKYGGCVQEQAEEHRRQRSACVLQFQPSAFPAQRSEQ
jgi:hypothetical protein